MKKDLVSIKEVKMNWSMTSHGTSGMGYVSHKGVTVILSDETVINGYYGYSSKAYGTWHDMTNCKYYGLNGRFLDKYNGYRHDVVTRQDEIMEELQTYINKPMTLRQVKRLLKYVWFSIDDEMQQIKNK